MSEIKAPIKLNLGCGYEVQKGPGWINVDAVKLDGVDVVHDLNVVPLPFGDESASCIVLQDVLEHVNYIPLLKDCLRILKPGGEVIISVPHFSARNNYMDPTHINRFSFRTFDYFVKSTHSGSFRSYYFDFKYSSYADRRILFILRPLFFYNYPLQWLVNLSDATRNYYEATGLCRLFPALNIQLTLVK